jgi:hypothetical protein
MTKQTGGLRGQRRPDVMELLARARPARLDPSTAPQPAEVAAQLAASGRPLASPVPAPPVRRIPRAVVLSGTATAAAAAVAAAVLAANAGAPGAAGQGRAQSPVLLTAAMVRQVASASRSALALSGQATIRHTNSGNGVPQDSGTDTITFSGKNWNDVISETFLGAGGRPGHTQTAINRIVNGQFYLYAPGRSRRPQWYHDTNPSGHPSFSIPDPRTVLRVLEPSARFAVVGHQVIDGVPVKVLRATDLRHLPRLGMLSEYSAGPHVLSLEVWVDAHGVVHRLSLTSQAISEVYPVSAENVRHKAHRPLIFTVPDRAMAASLRAKLHRQPGGTRVIIRVAPPGSGAPHREVQVTMLTVTFSAIGQPQRITAPAHAIGQFGRG